MAYIIQTIPKHSKKIIIYLGKYYRFITGNNIENIDWENINHIPQDFTDKYKKIKIPKKFEHYLFGRIVINKYRYGRKVENDFSDYLLQSNLFRKKHIEFEKKYN